MTAAAVTSIVVAQGAGCGGGSRRREGERQRSSSPRAEPGEESTTGVYRAPTQHQDVHNKYLADRADEEAQYGRGRGVLGVLIGCLCCSPSEHRVEQGGIRLQVERRERRNSGIIDPRTSLFISNWDLFVMWLLLFTTLVTPFEVVFMKASKEISVLFVVNRIVDGSFIFDMFIQFNLAIQAPAESGGMWLFDRDVIRMRYLSFWFWVDLVSVLPIYLTNFIDAGEGTTINATMALTNTTDPNADDKTPGQFLQILRMVRLLRLIKITRIIKASRIFKRFETNMEVTYAFLGMMKLMIFLFAWSHLIACFWGLVPQITGEGYSWIDALQESSSEPLHAWDLYVAGLYFSIMTVTSIGYGEMLPVNTSERVICSAVMLSSSIVWCYVMGQACSIAATMDPASIDFKSNMDSLNMFMRERGLPRSLKIALRTYFHNSRRLHRAHADGHLIGMMSPLMQSTVALQANKSWLDRIWFLRADWYTGDSQLVHSAFVASISQKLKTQACIGQERVAGGLLCIVNRGLAIKSWRFRSAGNIWGEDMILDNPALIDYSEAVAMTYLEVYTLHRPALEHVCHQFPQCSKRIRMAARKMMIQRLVIKQMRSLAGLSAPKSFAPPPGVATHGLPAVSLEQKVDILIDSSAVATHKLHSAENQLDGAGANEGGDDGTASGVALTSNACDGSVAASAREMEPSSAPLMETRTDRSCGASSGGTDRDRLDANVAVASFERLVAMHRDVAALQTQMGEELARLSASLGRGRGARPFLQARRGVTGQVSSLSRAQPFPGRGVTPLSTIRHTRDEDDEHSTAHWAASARRLLPSWAQTRSEEMSA